MSKTTKKGEAADLESGGRPPKPKIKKMRWPFPILWVIPILAAVGAGFYWVSYKEEEGPAIEITFKDAAGLRVGESTVAYRGVELGKVEGVKLSDDMGKAVVTVRLHKAYGGFDKEGGIFWVVRPEISELGVSGLGTVVSGPYIEARPGSGKEVGSFVGLDREPRALGQGLRVVLHAPSLEHLEASSPVFYRGVQVGVVEELELNRESTGINVRVFVWERYAALVRAGSEFWVATGADVEGGIMTGVKLKVDSVKTLLSGGIAFATPDPPGEMAREGEDFVLNFEAKKEWAGWSPVIGIAPAPAGEKEEGDQKEGGEGKAVRQVERGK